MVKSILAALIAVGALAATEATAQDYIRADCRTLVKTAGFSAGSHEAQWYRRFWTGDCGGLRGCFKGSPNWNEVVAKLGTRARPADRAEVLSRSCKLGPLIGMEWVKPKKVRRIDTGDLRGFNGTLEKAGDVLRGLAAVEAQARAKIGR